MKKVHFPYKEPRIDQRFFQAEIPPLKGRAPNRAVTRGSLSPRAATPPDLRPGQLSPTENCVWSPSLVADREALDRFLLFGRNLLVQSSGETTGDFGHDSSSFSWRSGANNSLVANESDEAALAFLYKHAGDVSRAEFHIASQVSSGAGARSMEISEVKRGPPQQLTSWQSAYAKRLDVLGFFESSEVGGYAYPSELVRKHVERKHVEPSSSEDDGVWDPEREEDGCEDVDDDDADDPGEAEDDTAVAVVPAAPQELERSRRGADRAAFKNRWNALQERIRDIRQSRKSSRKPTLRECVAILDEAASLPPPEQAPGEDFVDQAQQAVKIIWDMTAKARDWLASVYDLTSPGSDPRRVDGARAASITDLQKFVSEANSLPVTVAEADEVARIIQTGLDWQRKVEEMLGNLHAPTRTRAGRGSHVIQVSVLKDVLEEAEGIPVRLEQRTELQERVQSASVLAASISEAFPPGRRVKTRPSLAMAQNFMDRVKASGLDFPEASMLKRHLSAVNDWTSKAKSALSGSVPLRDLEKLVTEADKLAVDPGPKQTELQGKMDKALAWLEKLRKAVPKQRSTRRNATDPETEKVDLSHVKGLLSASSTTGVEMDMKEFSHTNDLIENAEEWMARVREVLKSGEPATLQGLEALLSEAEGIPVTMDEQQLLTVGIKARQWRLRVDGILTNGKAKLHELQDLASKGAALRAGFPKDAKSHPVYGVLDDSQLQSVIKRAKAWTCKARQCLQTMQTGRPMVSSLPTKLLEEAKSIKLNLGPEVDTVGEAVSELNRWRADHAHILESLGLIKGVPMSETHNSVIDNSPKNGGATGCVDGNAPIPMVEDRDFPDDDKNTKDQSRKQGAGSDSAGGMSGGVEKAKKKITSQSLSACIHAVEKITIGRSLKDLREMRTVQHVVHEWVEQCQSLCPRRQSKRRVQPSNKPTFERLQKLIADGLACPVSVDEEVERIRRHIAEALLWQVNAKSVLEKVTSALADETIERREIWRKEEERDKRKRCGDEGDNASQLGESSAAPDPGDATGKGRALNSSVPLSESARDTTKGASSGTSDGQIGKGKDCGTTEANDADGSDDDGDAIDREEELDEAVQSHAKALQHLLTTARDISVFMPEEMVTERIQKIMEWARSVRESAAFAGEGLQLSQAKEIMQIDKTVLDLKAGDKLEITALTPSMVKSLQLVIDCYEAKVKDIQEKLQKAEAWMVKAKELMARETVKMEEMKSMLRAAVEFGVENEDICKKIRNEIGRCKAWGVKADAAFHGINKLSISAVKKLIIEGEKIKASGGLLRDLKHHMKLASRWLQRLKKTGIEKGTASINELKAMIPEAAGIRIDLSEDVKVLKQATCSYCICSRPGEDLGFLVECKQCKEGYHGMCMGVSAAEAEVLHMSEKGYQCIRCRISNLFTSAEQAMLTAMKKWMPSTCFAEQAGFAEIPLADESGRERWQASQNFAALAGVVRDAMNLPRKKIRTSLGVLSEVDNNINALTTLPWGNNASGQEQHQYARSMLCSLRVLLWCTMAQWAVRKPPQVFLLYDLVAQGRQLTQVDHQLLETLENMANRASMWEASVREIFRATAGNADNAISVGTLRKLLGEAKHIPVLLPLEAKVSAALDDGGNRYCLCRGPNDGSFMVACDVCQQWFHGECVNLKEGEGNTLTKFECPACAHKKGGQYMYGKIDVEALRERGIASPPAIPDVSSSTEEDANSGGEVTGTACTWPPPEAEYFFGTLDLTQLAGSDPGLTPMPNPEPQTAGIMQTTSEAYRYQEIQRMSQVPVVESNTAAQVSPPFPGQQYLAPATASSAAPSPYGGLAYYQHYPRAGNVDPYHPHANFTTVKPSMATSAPQGHSSDPYSFPMHARPVPEPAAAAAAPAAASMEEGVRKRAAEVAAAGGSPKRVRTDNSVVPGT